MDKDSIQYLIKTDTKSTLLSTKSKMKKNQFTCCSYETNATLISLHVLIYLAAWDLDNNSKRSLGTAAKYFVYKIIESNGFVKRKLLKSTMAKETK